MVWLRIQVFWDVKVSLSELFHTVRMNALLSSSKSKQPNDKRPYNHAASHSRSPEYSTCIGNLRDLYRGINDFKKGYQPRTCIVKDEKGDLVADSTVL